MNIVKSGAKFQIYGNEVQVFNKVPCGTYTINFNPHMGFSLIEYSDLSSNEEIVYGDYEKKINKVFRGYEATNRNFGIILSGNKGVGKSLFAKLLAEEGIKKGLPIIIANKPFPGTADFLSSLKQEAIVIFDEFEKVFKIDDENNYNPQTEFLSLFDGIDNGKKLFIITCNDSRSLSEYFLNRPGRFHYHFEIKCPTVSEIKTYMLDKLGEKYLKEIEKVLKLSRFVDMTFDQIRAICFDLALGNSIEETLRDINISYEQSLSAKAIVKLNNDLILENSFVLNPFSREIEINFYENKGEFTLSFNPSELIFIEDKFIIDINKVKFNGRSVKIYDETDFNSNEYKPKSIEFKIINYFNKRDYTSLLA